MTELTATQRAIHVIVAQHLPEGEEPHLNAHLVHDLHLSAETRLDIIEWVEERFGFVATDDEVEAIQVVADLAALVDEHLQAEAA